ncbi:hypothetical protein AURDEDRAFT_166613 [Auricularia subglabra TFB-10046 SS5]|nr:hypothetical protein AURDEDRAFT_166613 [Auricularia subglabra TFB-10046 SS5]
MANLVKYLSYAGGWGATRANMRCAELFAAVLRRAIEMCVYFGHPSLLDLDRVYMLFARDIKLSRGKCLCVLIEMLAISGFWDTMGATTLPGQSYRDEVLGGQPWLLQLTLEYPGWAAFCRYAYIPEWTEVPSPKLPVLSSSANPPEQVHDGSDSARDDEEAASAAGSESTCWSIETCPSSIPDPTSLSPEIEGELDDRREPWPLPFPHVVEPRKLYRELSTTEAMTAGPQAPETSLAHSTQAPLTECFERRDIIGSSELAMSSAPEASPTTRTICLDQPAPQETRR